MPNRATPLNVIGAIVSISMLSACVSNQTRINQFAQFAEAGSAYTESIDGLLDASLATAIEADNHVLILARNLNKDSDFRSDALDEHDGQTKARAKVHEQLRVQLRLLQDYFAALGVLASSAEDGVVATATSGIADSTENLAKGLAALSDDIAKATIGEQPVSKFLAGTAVPLAVTAYKRAALDRALENTAKSVGASLNVHQAALQAIREQMKADLDVAFQKQQSETISGPFIGEGNLPDDWGELRTESLMRQIQIVQVDEAIAASDKLQLAFQALVEKRADGSSFAVLIQDLKKLVDFAEQLT